MSGAVTPLPHVPKWPTQEQVSLHYLTAAWLVTQHALFLTRVPKINEKFTKLNF
jgi:hypothetical protein